MPEEDNRKAPKSSQYMFTTSGTNFGGIVNIIQWRDALYESQLSYKAKHIGIALSQFYRRRNSTFPSIRTLSDRTSLTINPVQDGIKELEASDFIVRKQIRQKGNSFLSNIYVFQGVTEEEHVSPHDTSNDTSYDISPHDTEVGEVEEGGKEEETEEKKRKKHQHQKKRNFQTPLPNNRAREKKEDGVFKSLDLGVGVKKENGVRRLGGVLEAMGGGVKKYDIREHISDKTKEIVRDTHGLDVDKLAFAYNGGVNQRGIPHDPNKAFIGWCELYTKNIQYCRDRL